MKRLLLLFAAFALLATAACSKASPQASSAPTATPILLSGTQLEKSLLGISDVGAEKWEADPSAGPSTVLIGGKVGPGNVVNLDGTTDATSAFKVKDGTGYVSDTLVALPDEAEAQQVMAKHADSIENTWTQEFKSGGGARFTHKGGVPGLADLGDERFGVTLQVKIVDSKNVTTNRRVEYVAFRIKNLIGFVVTQDAGASLFASRFESKVVKLS